MLRYIFNMVIRRMKKKMETFTKDTDVIVLFLDFWFNDLI